MISAALLATTLALGAPVIPADPFLPDSTLTWQTEQGIVPGFDGYPIALIQHTDALIPATYTITPPQAAGGDAGTVLTLSGTGTCGDDLATTSGQYHPGVLLTGCQPDLSCPIPEPADISDRTTMYEMRIGLLVDGLDEVSFPAGTPKLAQVLSHIRADFQTIARAFLQVGVLLRIQHIYIRDQHFGSDEAGRAAADAQQCAMWPTLTMNRPVEHVIRLSNYAWTGSAGLVCNDGTFGARAEYSFALTEQDPFRNAVLRTVTHEMGHLLLRLAHTMRYHHSNTGEPLESCGGPEGPLVCPPRDEISVMGYCTWNCYQNDWAWIRWGVIDSPMWLIARSNVLVLAAIRNLPVVAHLPIDGPDSDQPPDEIPDAIDNCRTVSNNTQIDNDMDGFGNLCDSCAIRSPKDSSGAWILLLPLLIVIWRRSA
jgi:hypothetical protein